MCGFASFRKLCEVAFSCLKVKRWHNPAVLRSLQGQNYFHNNTKIFFFFILIFSWEFQKLYNMWYYNRWNLEATLRIQLSSIRPDIKEISKNVKQFTFSLSITNSRSLLKTHVHWVGDAIQPFHPLSSPSPPALNLSHHQVLFKWVSSSHQVAKVLEFQLQHQSFQWIFRTDFL